MEKKLDLKQFLENSLTILLYLLFIIVNFVEIKLQNEKQFRKYPFLVVAQGVFSVSIAA